MVAFTKWGYPCANAVYPSYRKTKKDALYLIENGFAFSYKITML